MSLRKVPAWLAVTSAVVLGYPLIQWIRILSRYWKLRKLNPNMKIRMAFFESRGILVLLGLIPKWMGRWTRGWEISVKASHAAFMDVPHATIGLVYPIGTVVHCADPALCNELMINRSKDLPKPAQFYKMLGLFGTNLVASEGDVWRRHRRVVGPSFGERLHSLVFDTSQDVVNAMAASWFEECNDGSESEVHTTQDAQRFTLKVFCQAAFGIKAEWDSDKQKPPPGHSMVFETALRYVVSNIVPYVVMPRLLFKWIYKEEATKTIQAAAEFQNYIREMLDNVSEEEDVDKQSVNILASLARSAHSEDPKSRLGEKELISNGFILVFAGYETTAVTIDFILTFLALHPHYQTKLHDHVKSVIHENGGKFTYNMISQMTFAQAIINETLRMVPPAARVPKWTGRDGLKTFGPFTLPPKVSLVVNVNGLHYNTDAWGQDVETFRPERFLEPNWPKQAFVPFSMGPRSCIGRRFSEIEMVVALCTLSQRFTWRLPDDVNREDVLKVKTFLTAQPVKPHRLLFKTRE